MMICFKGTIKGTISIVKSNNVNVMFKSVSPVKLDAPP